MYIKIPQEVSHSCDVGRPFKVRIEYTLENPQAGIHFYVPADSTTQEVLLINGDYIKIL